jgi:dipeptidyl aminopeptidase/acylaminoacyl peptidase
VTIDPQTLRWVAGPEPLTVGVGNDTDIAISPDGKRLAYATRTETNRAWSLPFDARAGIIKGQGQPITPAGINPGGLNLSPDGKKFAYVAIRSGSQKVELWEKSLADSHETLLAVSGTVYTPSWSRDGSRIAYRTVRPATPFREGFSILALPAGGGDETVIASGADDLIWDWSADGQWILVTTDRNSPRKFGQLCLYPLSASPHAETQMRVITSSPEYNLFQARISPDDRWICFVGQKVGDTQDIYVVSTSGGAWTRITEGKYWDDKPHWSPDGKTIYFISKRGGFLNVWGIRFDPTQGKPVGEPFRVTSFENPGRMIPNCTVFTELGIAANRLVLPLMEVSGSIWILENVDR